ncbi:MAG: hypothetical protein U1A27_10670 [Phycisphaerae bacterium]
MSDTRRRRRSSDRAWARWGATLVVLALLPACIPDTEKTVSESRDDRAHHEREAEMSRELAARDQLIRQQAEQIRNLQGVTDERAKLIPHAARIEIDALSGGYNDDGRPGDDGVAVYIEPFDDDGDSVKAAGSLTVEVVELSAPESSRVLASATLEGAALRKAWYGRFMTAHFTVKMPWRDGVPTRGELVVRARFVDWVSGAGLTAVRLVKVSPAAAATTRPAP